MKNKTPKQIATSIENAIKEINCVIKTSILTKEMNFFNLDSFKKSGLDLFIFKTCEKYDVNEEQVRRVGQFNLKSVLE